MSLRIKHFVLKPESKKYADRYAEASRRALVEYSRAIADYDPDLARDLMAWVKMEQKADELMLGKELTGATVYKNEIRVAQPRYDELLEKESVLNKLRAAGVDNWEGYEDAMQPD